MIASLAPWPALPKSGSTNPIVFAARKACFTAAGEEMSGFGAFFGTATAIRKLAIGVALLGMTLPDAMAPKNGATASVTSRASPFVIVCLVLCPVQYGTFTFW